MHSVFTETIVMSRSYRVTHIMDGLATFVFFHVQDYTATVEIKGYYAKLFYYIAEFINKRCLKYLYRTEII